jgi:hypothetical protein
MLTYFTRAGRWPLACALATLLVGCDEPTVTAVAAGDPSPAATAQAGRTPSVLRDLAALRRATARFHRFERAAAAGWSAKITPCMSDPSAGGMGFHYGNVGLIDGTVRVDEPELLLYEPRKNGRLRLVAVEYIIPYTFHSRSAEPPVLFGQQFKQNDTFQLWGLHAWVWKHNPSGVFASWNPRVTCAFTTDVMTMAHS